MPRLATVLISLAVLFAGNTGVRAMAFMPDPLTKQDRKATPAEKKQYDVLFADKVVVKKSERKLYLLKDEKPFRTYRVSLGFKPKGHKQQQGDGRTPEGRYYIDLRNPGSKYRKSLRVSYPNRQDRLHAMRRGVDPGGMIMVHGQPVGGPDSEFRREISKEDWTKGCIAVSNMAIDEIWGYTRQGTPIEILP